MSLLDEVPQRERVIGGVSRCETLICHVEEGEQRPFLFEDHAKTGKSKEKAVAIPSQPPKSQPTAHAWGRCQLGYGHMHAITR